MTALRGRVLAVAGSDSGGGAGIQADIKTITALGAYAATAITAVTAQDSNRVHGIVPLAPDFVRRQIAVVLDDIGADVVKTGMLGSAETVVAVCAELEGRPDLPVVVDPVMTSKDGSALLDPAAVSILVGRLLPRAALLTPNVPEVEVLTGLAIADAADVRRAADALLRRGAQAVLPKGGHLPGETVTDLLVTPAGTKSFTRPRIATRHTHGTGCTLASAIAARLAQGDPLTVAVTRARAYVQAAIAAAPGFGRGSGPLNHAALLDPDRLA